MKIQRIIFNSQRSLQHFSSNNFSFDNFKFIDLNLSIPPHEKDDFSYNNRFICSNQDLCIISYKLNLKVLFGEDERDLEIAKKRVPYMYFFTRCIHLIFAFTSLKLIYSLCEYFYSKLICNFIE